MDDVGRTLWERVCATVTRLGEPRAPRSPILVPITEPTSLDLHGYTVQDAFLVTRDFITTSSAKYVTIVTGKSGDIRREFPYWLDRISRVHSHEELNGGGAFRVRLR